VTLSFADAVRGVTVPLRLSAPGTCDTCHGSGAAPGTTPHACSVCGGAGVTSRNQGGFAFAEPCKACRGSGQVVDSPCPTCRGSGAVTKDRTLTVRVPAGVDDGQRIRLAGRGAPGERGGPAGDLLVLVHVTPHKVFRRKGPNLTLTLPVTYPEAALGADVSVPTLDGPVTLRLPAGTANGRTFRVKGRGVPRKTGAAGDLLVTVEVAVPQTLSADAREALEKYAAAAPDDPREHLREVV
jgi:molecular chaperone DnaJ